MLDNDNFLLEMDLDSWQWQLLVRYEMPFDNRSWFTIFRMCLHISFFVQFMLVFVFWIHWHQSIYNLVFFEFTSKKLALYFLSDFALLFLFWFRVTVVCYTFCFNSEMLSLLSRHLCLVVSYERVFWTFCFCWVLNACWTQKCLQQSNLNNRNCCLRFLVEAVVMKVQ